MPKKYVGRCKYLFLACQCKIIYYCIKNIGYIANIEHWLSYDPVSDAQSKNCLHPS